MFRWRERTFVIQDGDGSVRLPADSQLLSRLYNDVGVRVRVVKRLLRPRRPTATVGQLIDELSKKHKEEDHGNLHICSSSTPTATFPGSDLLYGSDGLPRTAQGSDELAGSDISGYERDRQRLRDLEIGNKRPTSRSKRPAYAVVDKVSFDRERDDARSGNNSLPVKAPAIRNGIRNSLVRGEQLLSQRNSTGSNSGRDPDDLIAMGTLWSPANNNVNNNNNNSGGSSSNGQTRSSSNTTNSNKSIPAINNNTANNNNNNFTNGGAGGGSSTQRKPISVSLNSGRLGHSSSFNGISNVTSNKLGAKDVKEVEPKYNDPLIGAPASFQQRLMELASLEAETIRWERIKKVKKKPKQDRDS